MHSKKNNNHIRHLRSYKFKTNSFVSQFELNSYMTYMLKINKHISHISFFKFRFNQIT
jgi:hypothetical protein